MTSPSKFDRTSSQTSARHRRCRSLWTVFASTTRSRFRRCVFLAAIAPRLASGVLAADSSTPAIDDAIQSISADKLQRYVNVLADDPFEGRETGSRGGRAAGAYLESELEKRQLEPAGPEHHYFQDFGFGSRNLLARIEGSDPDLKQQYVIVSAHYDHVGYGKKSNSYGPLGYIHHGADDNASGVSGLLNLADALDRLPQRPRRSLLLAFWDGEEAGLLGSRDWIANPTVPLDRVSMVVNMDMIGRLRQQRLEIYGTRTAPGLRRSLSEANRGNLLLDFHWEIKPDSDHFPFIDHGIPALLFCTGLHADYHRPSDTADKINSDGMRRVTQLAMRTVLSFANADVLPSFRPKWHGEGVAEKAAFERPAAPPNGRLGIILADDVDEKAASEQAGQEAGASSNRLLLIHKITANSPAAKAGLKVGDRIVEFAGVEASDRTEFHRLVLAASNPAAIVVERPGSERPLKFSVQLNGEPIRIGISWQRDDAEPRSISVVAVVPDSPAERAGIKAGDRIYQVSGHGFSSDDEFQKLLIEETNPIRLEIENQGRIRTVVLTRADEQDGSLEEARKPQVLRLTIPTSSDR
jgi:hypothetical protein